MKTRESKSLNLIPEQKLGLAFDVCYGCKHLSPNKKFCLRSHISPITSPCKDWEFHHELARDI